MEGYEWSGRRGRGVDEGWGGIYVSSNINHRHLEGFLLHARWMNTRNHGRLEEPAKSISKYPYSPDQPLDSLDP